MSHHYPEGKLDLIQGDAGLLRQGSEEQFLKARQMLKNRHHDI